MMALSTDQLRNIRNGVERSPLRGFTITYTKPQFKTALDALDSEFEAVSRDSFGTRLGTRFSAGEKRIMIKQWLLTKGRDF